MSPISWTTPRTWAAAETITAALLNTHLRDNLLAIGGAWTSYTPTLTQSVTVSKAVTYAKYLQAGKLVVAVFNLAVTGSGTSGQPIYVGLPVTAASGVLVSLSSGVIYDASVGHYQGSWQHASTTTVVLICGGYNTYAGQSPSFGLVSGDGVRGGLLYEAA